MLKVLIADDEEKICWLIQKLINWEGLGLELAGTASNGQQALAMIREHQPDIVITDVCMPDMDGLSMIHAVLEARIPTTFVVVSGHRQFEYAYSALKYGVEDYLLKPIKKRELHTILEKITSRIRQERAFTREKEQEADRSTRRTGLLRRKFIADLRTQPVLTEDRETINEHFGFSFIPGAYYAAVCKVDVVLNCVGQVKTDFVCDRVIDMVHDTFRGLQYEFDCCAEEATVTVILNTQNTAPHDILRELLGQLHLYADTFECYRISLSISDAVCDIAELPSAARQAHALIGNRLFQGNRQLLLSNTRPLVSEEPAEQLFPLSVRNLMRREIEAFHISVFRTQVLELFSRLNQNPVGSAVAYYRLARLITGFIFQIISENVWDENTVQQERALLEAHIQNVGSRVELAEMLAERLGNLLIRCEEARRSSESRPIRTAKEYITAHYGETLTLEEVAEKAGLSPSYFSLLFKRELGASFSDYLVELRMKAARQLLEETDETIACVAEHVGYRDVKYFSRLFQRMVGVNPSKYRKLHS